MSDGNSITIPMVEYIRLQNSEMENDKLKRKIEELEQECSGLRKKDHLPVQEERVSNTKVYSDSLEIGIIRVLRLIGEKEIKRIEREGNE